MKDIFWFIKQSIILDIRLLVISEWSILKKIHFVLMKYFLIVKHAFKKFTLGADFCWFNKKKIYYNTKFGLAGYQRLLCTHQNLINLAGIAKATTVIDIGANVGFFTMLSRDLFPESKIFACEPVPRIFQCLKNNFENDKNTQVFEIAISDFDGTAKMNFDEHHSSVSQITNSGNLNIIVKRLDDFVKENNINRIDLLKIDTKTFEAHVVRGGQNSLKITKYLFIEVSMEKDNKNYSISSLLKQLSTDNYNFQLVCFRNFDDVSEGTMSVMDALFVNKMLI